MRTAGGALGALTERLQRSSAELFACAFAIAWFFYLGYGPTLRPTNIAWMLRGDWAAYFWGFAFFRNAEWLWPLGNTPGLFFPYGTSVGFTDANPWASVLFKVLSPVLPEHFQFSGMWFLLCYVLLALLGTRIAAVFTDDKVRRALSGALFASNPLLPVRNGHVALCGLFFVVAGVYLNLAPARSRADALRLSLYGALWLAWVAGTHGYLSVMLLALCIAACVRLAAVERLLKAAEAALIIAGYVATVLAVFWIFGYLGWRPTELRSGGFGKFSGDLTALVNPMGWSRFLPSIPVRPPQGEGFAYLGIGALLLIAVRVVQSARAPADVTDALRRQWPLLVAALAMWLYSLSSQVTFRGQTVLELHALYEPFKSLTGIFRGSGRFSWPLHFVLVTLAVAAAARLKNAKLGCAALLTAVVLQAAELDPSKLDFHEVQLDRLEHSAWAESEAAYQHLALVPLNLLWVCRYDHTLVNRLAYEAYRRRWTFNSGNLIRKQAGVKALCDAPISPDPDTIYVADPRQRRILTASNFTCGRLDGLSVCVSSARPTPLLTALRASPK
jgi:hypothetical protein